MTGQLILNEILRLFWSNLTFLWNRINSLSFHHCRSQTELIYVLLQGSKQSKFSNQIRCLNNLSIITVNAIISKKMLRSWWQVDPMRNRIRVGKCGLEDQQTDHWKAQALLAPMIFRFSEFLAAGRGWKGQTRFWVDETEGEGWDGGGPGDQGPKRQGKPAVGDGNSPRQNQQTLRVAWQSQGQF